MRLIDAIARERQQAKEQRSHIGTWDDEYSKKCEVYAEEHEQLAEWLEELKALKENSISKEAFEKMKSRAYEKGHRQGYNKAIDDFAEHIRTYYALKQEMGYVATTYKDLINYIFELAEQLKAGVKNE